MTPESGAALREACVACTGRPPDLVVLTHYHNDHVRGAVALPDATLVSTRGTRERIDTLGRDELAADIEAAEGRVAFARALQEDDDPVRRASGALLAPYAEALRSTAPGLELRLPDVAVDGELEIHGSRRRAILRPFGGGHSGDDAVVILPDDGVVFCGDLLFVAFHPFVADGDPAAARAALDDLAALDAAHYVPGHGPPAGPEALDVMRRYLDDLARAADGARERGLDPAEVAIPEPYRDWGLAVPFFHANLRFVLGR